MSTLACLVQGKPLCWRHHESNSAPCKPQWCSSCESPMNKEYLAGRHVRTGLTLTLCALQATEHLKMSWFCHSSGTEDSMPRSPSVITFFRREVPGHSLHGCCVFSALVAFPASSTWLQQWSCRAHSLT